MNANKAFKILKLEHKFPIEESTIKKAFHKLAKKAHPDTPTGSNEAMQELNEAYQFVLDHRNDINYARKREEEKKEKLRKELIRKQSIENKKSKLADKFIEDYKSADINKKKDLIFQFVKGINKLDEELNPTQSSPYGSYQTQTIDFNNIDLNNMFSRMKWS